MPEYSLRVDSQEGLRLDIFLSHNLANAPSRSFVKRLIDSECVTVNGKSQKPNYHVHDGDEITVAVPQEELGTIEGEDIPLEIIYEDNDICVICKPSGLTVHPAPGLTKGTLVNALLYRKVKLSDLYQPFRPGIVHRLDKETSGVMVVAKNNRAHQRLARQFEKRKVIKKYVALVEGRIAFDEGMIDAPLGRHPRHPEKKAIRYANSKKAQTFYRVVKRMADTTCVALFPKTGRTHQLRVHMKHLGHPILGDAKYGDAKTFERLALHAQSLRFFHPETSAPLEFSVRLPKPFLDFCSKNP